jgi:protein-disulfide isomerase
VQIEHARVRALFTRPINPLPAARPFVLALLVAIASPLFADIAAGAEQAKSGDAVVAKIGDHPITEKQLDTKIRPQLIAADSQIYQLKRRALESIADDYLIEQAAKKANLSPADYIKREIDGKVPQPTDQEIQAFYAQHQGQIRQPLDKIKPQIAGFMHEQKARQVRQDLIAKLAQGEKLTIMIQPPRAEVATQGFPSLGPQDAPITIVEFSDFQCPYCRKAEDSLKAVRQKYGDKVRLVYRDFPLDKLHPNAQKAAEAGNCAADQGKFWQYHDALFADPSKLGPNDLKATAAKVGINGSEFSQCLDGSKYAGKVSSDAAAGNDLGVQGTPTFFINGRSLNGAASPQAFDGIIDEELAHSALTQAAIQ